MRGLLEAASNLFKTSATTSGGKSARTLSTMSGSMFMRAVRLLAQDAVEQHFRIPIIWHNDISPDTQQSLAFPFVDAAGAVVGLVAGHGHGQAAGFLGVLDLHITVAKGQQLRAADFVFAQQPVDDHLLREILVVILRAVDVRAEVSRDVEQFSLLFDERFVGAAGEVEREAAALK